MAAFRRFSEYYAGTPDPYGATPEVLQDAYAPVMALTVTLYATTNSTNYPLAFLASAVGGRIYPIVAPFDQPLLPGQGNPRKYAFIGDVSPQGNIPTMMEILNEHFHLTVNQPVPSLADMTARWATQVGDHYLAPEIDGVQGAETVRTRYLVPIPHQYISTILDSYEAGTLTWQWLWANVGSTIVQAGEQTPRASMACCSAKIRRSTIAGQLEARSTVWVVSSVLTSN